MDHDVFSGLIKLDIYRSSHPSAGAERGLPCDAMALGHPFVSALAAVQASINAFIDGDVDEDVITSARCR